MPVTRIVLSILLAAVLCAHSRQAQSQQARSQQTASPVRSIDEVNARLSGQPLMLRGFWKDDNLNFDSTGHPLDTYPAASFTLAGFNELNATIDGKTLTLKGERIGILFDAQGNGDRVPLRASRHGKKTEMITIHIAAGDDGDFAPALNAVFADSLREIAPTLPEVWQGFAQPKWEHLEEPTGSSRPDGRDAAPKHVGGPVKPPKLKSSPSPEFSEAARRLKYSGKTEIYLIVEEDDHPGHLRIVRPAGIGLDEAAVDAASQYVFDPATQDGHPVKVDIFLDVNFQIF